jgi:soluble lytic murein transglycosylase-like protein
MKLLAFLIFLLFFTLSISNGKAAELYSFVDKDGMIYFTNIPAEGRTKISLSLKRNPSVTSSSEKIESIILTVSERYSVDPNLIRAIIKVESNFNPNAISPKGALGLMQLMPETAKEMAVSNPFNPEENIVGGVKFFNKLLQLFNRDIRLALAAYNAGPGRVVIKNKVPLVEETETYILRIVESYRALKEGYKIKEEGNSSQRF